MGLFTGLLLSDLGGNVELAARWVYFSQLEVGNSWPTELPSGNLMGKIHHAINGKITTISTGPFSIAM